MKRAFTALFLCLAILLGIAETASGAYVDPGVKNRVGGFWENPNIPTYEIDPFAPETHRKITIPHYDIATDVVFFVNQNPWSAFDPHGLEGSYLSSFGESFVKRPLVHATSIVRGVLPPNIHPKDYYSVKGFTENAKWAWSKNPMTLALNPVSQQVGDTADVVSGKATHAEIKAKRVDPVIASVKRKLTTAEGHGELAADVVIALGTKKAGTQTVRNKVSAVTGKNKVAGSKAGEAVAVEAPKRIPDWCFVAGTLVKTSDGYKPIEEVEVGDEVVTRDEQTGEIRLHKVTETFHNFTDELFDFKVGEEILSTTGSHEFWLPRKKSWVPAKQIEEGDFLLAANGSELPVISIERRKHICDVYNLEIETNHNYFVGNAEVLVHNGDPGLSDYNQARNAALDWLDQRGFKADKQVFGKFGDVKGSPVGMQTADGRVGFRVEFTEKQGAHINVWDHNAPKGQQKGPHFSFEGNQKSVNQINKRFYCK